MEQTAISEALTAGPMILSTGGGSICAESTAQVLCERSTVVWLRAEPETLLSRIGSVGSRPLLHGDDPLQTLRKLAETRAGDYGKAHITVQTDDPSAHSTTNAVLRALDNIWRSHRHSIMQKDSTPTVGLGTPMTFMLAAA